MTSPTSSENTSSSNNAQGSTATFWIFHTTIFLFFVLMIHFGEELDAVLFDYAPVFQDVQSPLFAFPWAALIITMIGMGGRTVFDGFFHGGILALMYFAAFANAEHPEWVSFFPTAFFIMALPLMIFSWLTGKRLATDQSVGRRKKLSIKSMIFFVAIVAALISFFRFEEILFEDLQSQTTDPNSNTILESLPGFNSENVDENSDVWYLIAYVERMFVMVMPLILATLGLFVIHRRRSWLKYGLVVLLLVAAGAASFFFGHRIGSSEDLVTGWICFGLYVFFLFVLKLLGLRVVDSNAASVDRSGELFGKRYDGGLIAKGVVMVLFFATVIGLTNWLKVTREKNGELFQFLTDVGVKERIIYEGSISERLWLSVSDVKPWTRKPVIDSVVFKGQVFAKDFEYLRGLEVRSVGGTNAHFDQGFLELFKSIKGCHTIEFENCNISDDHFRALVRGSFYNVRIIDCPVTGRCVLECFHVAPAAELFEYSTCDLTLDNIKSFTDDDLDFLPKRVREIDDLSIRGSQVTDVGFQRYIGRFKKLTYLDLGGTEISGRCLESFRTYHLEGLSLDETAIEDVSIGFLKNMPSLSFLNVSRTRLSDRALPALVDTRILKLDISRTKFPKRGFRNSICITCFGRRSRFHPNRYRQNLRRTARIMELS